jgi:hypothetical protein
MNDSLHEPSDERNLYDPPEGSVRPTDPNRPQTVFPTAYKLDSAQEKALVDHAMERLDQLEKELGRDLVFGQDWYAGGSATDVQRGAQSFLGRRQLYEMTYEGEVDWRAATLGGIFEESNWVVPISRRVVTQQVARANAHFFGTEPWFSVDLHGGGEDAEIKKRAERWTRSKFREGGIRSELEQAVERAFIRGEAVVKRAARVESDIYETEMTVLVDASRPDDKGRPSPVLDSRGEYVTPERQVRIVRELVEPQGIARALGGGPKERDAEYLADDLATRLPDGKSRRWEKRVVSRRSVLYSGPHAEVCYFKDILAPLNSRSLDIADCVVHLYDIPVSDLADQWRRETDAPGEEQRNIDTAAAVAAIQAMRGNSASSGSVAGGSPVGASASHRQERSEDRDALDGDTRATAKVAEFWLRFDANGDGILENILLVVDRESRLPIVYDYVSNVTPDGRRPFSVIRINPVPGRWYGFGSMQVYEAIQNICDLQVNRWNFSNSQSGRITFWNPEAIEGAETDTELEINWGETYRLRPDRAPKDAVDFVTLPEVKASDLKMLMDFYLQMALNMSGVQHANDAQMAGLQSAKLATSILNIDKAGHEMFGQLLSHLEKGIEECANALAEIAVVNMADSEPYEWEEDDHLSFGVFSREQVGESRLRIRLLLSKYKAEQEKVALGQVIDRTKEFFTLPPEAQEAMAGLYRQFLRAHDIEGADDIVNVGRQLIPGEGDPEGFAATLAPHGEPSEAPNPTQHSDRAEAGIAGGLAAAAARA